MSVQDQLYQLFLIDKQVRGLESRQKKALARLNAQQAKYNQLTQQLEELKSQIKQTQATAVNLEGEARSVDEKVNKLRDQMNAAKNNKEYQAFLIEVNTMKEAKGELENQALEYLTRLDELKAELSELETRHASQEKIISGAKKELDDAKSEVGEKLTEAQKELDHASQQLSSEARDIYMRVSRENDGDGLATVSEESRRHKEYTCQGCFMNLPIECVSTLMSRPDVIVQCPSCQRVLYMKADLKASLVK